MSNKNVRITSKKLLGRKPGKRFFTITITLSQAQIDYLKTKPNASGLIRKILDDLIASESHVEQKLSVVSMNFQLKQLDSKFNSLREERSKHLWENKLNWQTVESKEDGETSIAWVDIGAYPLMPKPLDTENGKVAYRVLQGYDTAIKVLEAQIAELKQKIISG